MKILITGHKGFIGSNLYKKIGGDGVDLKDGQDIRSYNFTEKYDVIFHLAAQASVSDSFENPIKSHSHNVLGTLKILEYARKTGANVVFSSSCSIYGNAPTPTKENSLLDPMSPYATDKLICEEYLKLYWKLGVKSVALRYFNVFGEGQEMANGGYALVLSVFLKQFKEGKPFTIVGTGEQRRDFVYVGDVVEANLKAAEFLKTVEKFEVFNIGGDKSYSINEVADMIDKNHSKEVLPPRMEPFEMLADISKAKELLDWSPKTKLENWIYESNSLTRH